MEPDLHNLRGQEPVQGPPKRAYTKEEKQYISELLDACFHDGILPSRLYIGRSEIEEDFARPDLDKDFFAQQTEWLRNHVVNITFHGGASNVPNDLKKQLIRVYENSWYDSGDIDANMKRGRYQNQGKNLDTYVASTRDIAQWMLQQRNDEIDLGDLTYRVSFLPWKDLTKMRAYKESEKDNIFWIRCPNFGQVVKVHPFEEYNDEPERGTIRLELEPSENQTSSNCWHPKER